MVETCTEAIFLIALRAPALHHGHSPASCTLIHYVSIIIEFDIIIINSKKYIVSLESANLMEERKRDNVPSGGAGIWKSKLQAIKNLVLNKYIITSTVSISDRRAVSSTKENQVTPISEISARNHKE